MRKFYFFVRKLLFYFVFGAVAAIPIIFPLGLLFGSPAVLLVSIVLATHDSWQLNAKEKVSVFNKKMWLMLLIEVLIVTVLLYVMNYY